jgi:hypothetical protein
MLNMMDDNKKTATLILGMEKDKPKGEEKAPESSEPQESLSAADDVFNALKDGDKKAFKGALKSFIYECMNNDMDEDESEYED